MIREGIGWALIAGSAANIGFAVVLHNWTAALGWLCPLMAHIELQPSRRRATS